MLKVLYEDQDLIVVVKPAGVESQAAKKFAPDMISEIKKHMVINKLCTPGKEPYVAVIHRLDKPVSGVMVYAKTKKAAAALSEQVQNRKMDKYYKAVVCGKLVNNVDNYVDYLKKSVDGNYSQVVDKGDNEAKRAELSYEVLQEIETKSVLSGTNTADTLGTVDNEDDILSLVKIHLLTGRHHQIRVQFSSHGVPLYGDGRYNPAFANVRAPLALCAVSLAFDHPTTKKRMEFSIEPSGGAFAFFR